MVQSVDQSGNPAAFVKKMGKYSIRKLTPFSLINFSSSVDFLYYCIDGIKIKIFALKLIETVAKNKVQKGAI